MNGRALLFIPAVALGVGLFIWQGRTSEGPVEANAVTPAPVPVRIAVVEARPLPVSIQGFGRVEPIRVWDAVSQVDGRVSELAEGFAVGTVYPAGTQVVRIEPRDYEIAVARAEANLQSAQAQLDELNAQEVNTREQLALEQEIEVFLQTDFDRVASLVERGAVSQSSQEQANRELLNQQRKVLDLRNQLALFPVQRVTSEATVRTREVELEEAQRNLEQTVILTPFRGRVAEEALSEDEYVRPGDALLSLHDVSASEIVAAVQPNALANAIRVLVSDVADVDALLQDDDAIFRLLSRLDLTVTVRQTIGDRTHVWPAEITRFIGAADTQTGTLGLVVKVERPMQPDPSTRRPPLNVGSFVEVQFAATGAADQIIIPRSAARYDRDGGEYVFVVGDGDTLARRDIDVSSVIDNSFAVGSGLEPGDWLILSEPQPAILGQPVEALVRE
ncbi:hypothetical protein [uncultured Roseobacter sp.]|uniref:efflux RND transporter periplasmic adaptor subunit n=1 Tax=uncultured Roseobacter sp. TaxID=114847 RepID=UPI00262DC639|nr:hypothetical protein [uncultured Roseobacter sp.]